ncbi:hypothetical protein LTR66_009796 [Elasticomyces elasticus]|nr:hypothetical protein LTR66_009796 [Elasticomyces elasticus]
MALRKRNRNYTIGSLVQPGVPATRPRWQGQSGEDPNDSVVQPVLVPETPFQRPETIAEDDISDLLTPFWMRLGDPYWSWDMAFQDIHICILIVLLFVMADKMLTLVISSNSVLGCSVSTVFLPTTTTITTASLIDAPTTTHTVFSTATVIGTVTPTITQLSTVAETSGPSYYFVETNGTTSWLNDVSPTATGNMLTTTTVPVTIAPQPTQTFQTTVTVYVTATNSVVPSAYTFTTFSYHSTSGDRTTTSYLTQFRTVKLTSVTTLFMLSGSSSAHGTSLTSTISVGSSASSTAAPVSGSGDSGSMTETEYGSTIMLTSTLEHASTTTAASTSTKHSTETIVVTGTVTSEVASASTSTGGHGTSLTGTSLVAPLTTSTVFTASGHSAKPSTSVTAYYSVPNNASVEPSFSGPSSRSEAPQNVTSVGPTFGSSMSVTTQAAANSTVTPQNATSVDAVSGSSMPATTRVASNATITPQNATSVGPTFGSSMSATTWVAPSSASTSTSLSRLSSASVSANTTKCSTTSALVTPSMNSSSVAEPAVASSSRSSLYSTGAGVSSRTSNTSLAGIATATTLSFSMYHPTSSSAGNVSQQSSRVAGPVTNSNTLSTFSTSSNTTILSTSETPTLAPQTTTASLAASSSSSAVSAITRSSSSTSDHSAVLNTTATTSGMGPTSLSTSTTRAVNTTSSGAGPTPTVCGEYGPFTLNWDDEPNWNPDKPITDPAAAPAVFNPYHHLYFALGYVYVPPPSDPFPPISPPRLTMFFTNETGADNESSPSAGGLRPGEISAGPRAVESAFWFDAYSAYLGCDNEGPNDCELSITGYQYNAFAKQEISAFQQNVTLPPCPGMTDCRLEQVQFPASFRGLSGLQFQASVGNEKKIFFMDDLSMAWSNNTCAAGLLRQRSR